MKNLKILQSFLPQDDTATINSFHSNDTELDFFSTLQLVQGIFFVIDICSKRYIMKLKVAYVNN